ncbi:hypothetical protein [Limnothrix redekei]|uniref:Uncharacterized protein n=1 Tax=Limnothrix redekei LRLZ20PSL1 TaxID=3112953 RepID=A0ABW7CCM0_9CYAN
MQTSMTLPEPITFEAAIELTQEWLDRWATGSWTTAEFATAAAQLVTHIAGARGFFVVYLTDERSIVDPAPEALVVTLAQSPDQVLELLVKNLAMAAAMVVIHERSGDGAMADQSRRTSRRSGNLLQQLDRYFAAHPALLAKATSPSVTELLHQLRTAATEQTGPFADFLERWGYDDLQRRAIVRAIEHVGVQPGR